MSRRNNSSDTNPNRIFKRVNDLDRNIADRAHVFQQQRQMQQHRMRQQLQQMRLQHHMQQQSPFEHSTRAQQMGQRQQRLLFEGQHQDAAGEDRQQHQQEMLQKHQDMIDKQRQKMMRKPGKRSNEEQQQREYSPNLVDMGENSGLDPEVPRAHVRDMINLFNKGTGETSHEFSGRPLYERSVDLEASAPVDPQKDANDIRSESVFRLLDGAIGASDVVYGAGDVTRYGVYEAAGRISGYAACVGTGNDTPKVDGDAASTSAGYLTSDTTDDTADETSREAACSVASNNRNITSYERVCRSYNEDPKASFRKREEEFNAANRFYYGSSFNDAYGYPANISYGYAAPGTRRGIAAGAVITAVNGAAVGAATETAAEAAALEVAETSNSVTDTETATTTTTELSGATAEACTEESVNASTGAVSGAINGDQEEKNEDTSVTSEISSTEEEPPDRSLPSVEEPDVSESTNPPARQEPHECKCKKPVAGEFRIVTGDCRRLINGEHETAYESKTKITKTARGVRITIDILFNNDNHCGVEDILQSHVETDVPQSQILSQFRHWTHLGTSSADTTNNNENDSETKSDTEKDRDIDSEGVGGFVGGLNGGCDGDTGPGGSGCCSNEHFSRARRF